jgi:hypothetical protein
VASLVGAVGMALVALVGVQVTAQAQEDERPPDAVLMKGDEVLQKGRLGSHCWFSAAGPGYCADTFGVVSFPREDRIKAGTELRVRMKIAQEPSETSLRSTRRVVRRSGDLYYKGPWREHPVSLAPVIKDGRTVAWDATFELNRPDRHYYMDFFARWEGRGDPSWAFHVKTRAGT